MSDERWLPVVGHEDLAEVSTLGRIRSVAKFDAKGRYVHGKVLKSGIAGRGSNRYRRVVVRRHHVKIYITVHRAVLEAFVGPAPARQWACHNDGDSYNNALENLRWDTASANNLDKVTHGTIARGERNGWAKLTAQIVCTIRHLLAEGYGPTELARRFELSRKHVQAIKRRQVWSHLQ